MYFIDESFKPNIYIKKTKLSLHREESLTPRETLMCGVLFLHTFKNSTEIAWSAFHKMSFKIIQAHGGNISLCRIPTEILNISVDIHW